MIRLDYGALDATGLQTDPFAHVVVHRFIAPEDLPSVLQELPVVGKGGLYPLRGLRAGSAFRDLVAQIQGQGFRDAVAGKFGLDLNGAPTLTTLRGLSRSKDGRIHCDSKSKRVTVLLYINSDRDAWHRHEGCLRLLRGPDDIENFAVEVPPVDGNLVIFENGPTAWHGYRKYVGTRYVLQLNYMMSKAIARSEERRHRISAFIKSLGVRA